MHNAIEKGFLEIVKYLYFCFKDTYAPAKYNVHYIDEYTRENAALIACKKCNLKIVKFLREECKVDFKLTSKRNESALHLAAFGSKTNKSEGFQVIKYLVEEAQVDVTFQYEEILLILDDTIILQYIEMKLKEKEITCTKEEVESKYSLSNYEVSKPAFLFEDDHELTLGSISSIIYLD